MMTDNTDDKNQPNLVVTGDGSHTLYSSRFDQHYHNPNGSVAESRHVFFETNRLAEALTEADQINVLEVGFGTGLNLMLLLDQHLASGSKTRITYHTIEAFPISADIASAFNYRKHLRHRELVDKLIQVFDSLKPGINQFQILTNIKLQVFYGLFAHYDSGVFRADYIFHDAFSPGVNQELWTGETFKKLMAISSPNALLTTYCAASKARGAMAWAGWHIARARGALGKREMTIASPNPDKINGFKRINEQRLAKRYAQGDF